MKKQLRLPVGIENFEEIRTNDYYYVDKTKLIKQVLQNKSKAYLFTRPRRFGKTLNMSMLKCFFEIGTNKALFDGLYISRNQQICKDYLGKYPVIFLTLKDVDGFDFKTAKYQIIELIAKEASRFKCLLESNQLDRSDKEAYSALIKSTSGKFEMDDDTLYGSLKTLSELLYKHYNKKVVVLIDEYDVPLDKAFQNGYYKEMTSLIRFLFGKVLKTNDYLEFAVLTGCLRISKESIFTGLNNFKVLSITDTRFDETFGFTDQEVKDILSYFEIEDRYQETKEWYDGYHFGNVDVYCPWDVINHVDKVNEDCNAVAEPYWINSSGNDLVKRFVDKANRTTRYEIEQLIAGKVIEKQIRLDLTYDEIDNSIDNLWSVLFTTGYLTYVGVSAEGKYQLVIPNKEVKEVFQLQIQEWFQNKIFSNVDALQNFWKDLECANTEEIERYLNQVLSNSISLYDAKGNEKERENSYHNLLVGILSGNADWLVKSNVEAGEGFADIIVETGNLDSGIVLELKYAKELKDVNDMCATAIQQIKEKRYFEYLLNEGRRNILLYGITFCKKRCKVVVEKYE